MLRLSKGHSVRTGSSRIFRQRMPSGDAIANSSRFTLTKALYRSSSLALGFPSRNGARLMPGPIHTRLLSFPPSNSSTPWWGLRQWMPSSLSA